MGILLYLAVFVCGFASLIYQVVWERGLALALGGGAYAVAAVISVFMAGLALGSMAGGAAADKVKRPLAWAAGLEAFVAAWALALPLLWLPGWPSIVLLLPPTFCMGASWPLVCVARVGRRASPGARTAGLYAANTLGASLGCFAAGFVMIRTLGVSRTNEAAAALSCIGAGLLWLASSKAAGEPVMASAPGAGELSPKVLAGVRLAAALTGFAALGYEILWFRALRFVIGSTAYSFCTMLTALLAGLALGALIVRIILRRGGSALGWFAAAQAALGILNVVSVRLFAHTWIIAGVILNVLARWIAVSPQSWPAARAVNFGLAFLVLLGPAVCLGCLFPLSNELLVRDPRHPGRSLGAAYFLNTAGCALAPAFATFYLIPALGINVSLLTFSALNLAIGSSFALWARRDLRALAAMGLAAAAALWLLPEGFVLKSADPSLLYERDGVLATIRVFRRGGLKFLSTDNFYVQGSDPTDPAVNPKRLGLMPYLLSPKLRLDRVLQIGLGTGINLGALAKAPASAIDVAEIVPELVEADALFEAENQGVLRDARVRVFAEDGRRFVARTKDKYDLIVGDLFFPDHAGAGNLYSAEHFRNCRRALAPGGIMVQWIPLHQVSVAGLKVIAATFADSFPHAALWWGTLSDRLPVVGLVGSEMPLILDEKTLRAKSALLASDMKEVLWSEPDCLRGNFIAGDAELRAFAGTPPLNTDDRPWIEFQTPRTQANDWDRSAIAAKLLTLAGAMETESGPAASSRRAHQAVLAGLAMAVRGDGSLALSRIDSGLRLAPRCAELAAVRREAEAAISSARGSSGAPGASARRAAHP